MKEEQGKREEAKREARKRDGALMGTRAIAVFEATKGAAVLAVGIGLLRLAGEDVHATGSELISHMHLNPAKHHPEIFVNAISAFSDVHLWTLACLAFVYAFFRLAEGVGLWFDKAWAEWLAALTGGIYIPLEAATLVERPSVFKVSILATNLAIVAFMAWLIWRRRKGGAV